MGDRALRGWTVRANAISEIDPRLETCLWGALVIIRCMSEHSAGEMRTTAREIFQQALAEASIPSAFARHVECERGVLRISEDLYHLSAYSNVLVVSFGKAAHSMLEALHARVPSGLQGIVVGVVDPPSQLPGFRYFLGGHPLPTIESVRAAEAILRALDAQTQSSLVIFLLSGGGSSLVEKPIDEEISLPDLVETYRVLVHSGAPIADINSIRKHLSATKGGRLAQMAAPAHQVTIMVSDVPDNALDALASGPTMPDTSSVEDCHRIVSKYNMLGDFPEPVRELFEKHALDETPKSDDPAFVRSRWWPVLSNESARDAAAKQAVAHRFAVEIDNSCDDWDYARAADYLLGRLRELRKGVSRACIVSGGEVTVKVTNGGIGGRNQHFALYCAERIAGENITVLSAGTDGIDGNSPAAGAVVDGTTIVRAEAKGLNAANALAKFDAYSIFDAIGDAIMTGPTGNNLRDLRIFLAY